MKSICVYCSSSDSVDGGYRRIAEELGEQIGRAGNTLIYGGANIGLMGALARATHRAGGRVVGVIPAIFRDKDLAYNEADELIITADLRERKATMEQRADAFIALPGGFGTLEEIAEILVLKQLRLHAKPLVLLNTDGFYETLLAFFERLYTEGFSKPVYKNLYYIAPDPAAALHHIETYTPPDLADKWFTRPPTGPVDPTGLE